MKVKGIGLITTRDFVKENFPEQYNEWIQNLSTEIRHAYSNVIDSKEWVPIKDLYIDPLDSIISTFYNNDKELGGTIIGAWSAEKALRGIYKAFLYVASPRFLLGGASRIISTYYKPCEIKIYDKSFQNITLHITEFDEMTESLEYRIVGWCKKALEMAGSDKVEYTISRSLAKNDSLTEITFSWEV